MSAAACLFAAAVSLSFPSTSAPSSARRRRLRSPTTLLRCSPTRRRGPVRRTLDERLLEAAPAETEDVQTAVDVEDGGGIAEGDEVGTEEMEELEQRPPTRAFVKSRRQRQEEEEAAAGQDRFKLINGKEIFQEKAYLVGVECKRTGGNLFGIEESLKELEQLADTAGLLVVGSTYQKQLRNLEKSFGGSVRVCDRTALILDIFNQRAATHEASLQVTLAQMEYQLPRLTKMWSHLERQAGGQVKGMGEKQIEVDKRILRTQISALRKELESVRKHRKLYRNRRQSVPIPVVSLVGYTNAGKSTLLNRLTGADVLAEDKLFATLDPTTRRVLMKNGTEFLLTDTVGFIQKLPTMLVAAFRATLEEISESSVIVHLVDISHPLAQQQIDAVERVLKELDVESIPKLVVWNKIDNTDEPLSVKEEAQKQGIICISAMNGDGLEDLCNAVQAKLKDSMVPIEAFVPYDKGDLLNDIHKVGMVEKMEYKESGTFVKAHVPLPLARLLTPLRQQVAATV
ncbi:GTP-binding protein hflX [Zea mays]|uniref:GTP-binding protein hflX n=1 Tax=Zea mays TaxID=4577 RepID=A0A1D6PR76_MAIZE|nr:GTP-binding protein hflX [Zea mays]